MSNDPFSIPSREEPGGKLLFFKSELPRLIALGDAFRQSPTADRRGTVLDLVTRPW